MDHPSNNVEQEIAFLFAESIYKLYDNWPLAQCRAHLHMPTLPAIKGTDSQNGGNVRMKFFAYTASAKFLPRNVEYASAQAKILC